MASRCIPEAYPALTKVVSHQEMGARRFDAGAVIWDGKTRHRLTSPLSEPKALPGLLRSPAIPTKDKLKLAQSRGPLPHGQMGNCRGRLGQP